MAGPFTMRSIRENNVERLRQLFKRLERHVTSVTLHLSNDGFLLYARPEDIPPQVRRLEIYYDSEGAASTPLLCDAHGAPLSGTVSRPAGVPRSAVERFAGILQNVAFSFHTSTQWDTSITYTPQRGWISRYDP